MSNLAAYRIAILALLTDAGNAIFSNDMVDQALRWALAEYSNRRPLIRTYQYSVDSTTGIHNLPTDFVTKHITKVELYDADPDSIIQLGFYAYKRDEQWIINTNYQVEAGEVLQVSYTDIHTVDNLDAAAGTTIPIEDEPILHIGAAGRAALLRSLDRVESINMNADTVKEYRQLAMEYIDRFFALTSPEAGVGVGSPEYPEVKF